MALPSPLPCLCPARYLNTASYRQLCARLPLSSPAAATLATQLSGVTLARSEAPERAQRLCVGRIFAPGYDRSVAWPQLLPGLFTPPRVVCEGDVVTVEHGGDATHYKVLELTGGTPSTRQAASGGSRAPGMLVGRATSVYERTPLPSRLLPVLPPPPAAEVAAAEAAAAGTGARAGATATGGGTARLPLHDSIQEILLTCFRPDSVRYGLCHPLMVHGPRGAGKIAALRHVCASFGVHVLVVSAFELRGTSLNRTEAYIREAFKKAAKHNPCVLVFRHVHALGVAGSDAQDGDNQVVGEILNKFMAPVAGGGGKEQDLAAPRPTLVAGTTHKPLAELPGQLRGCFVHTLEVEAPNESERVQLLASTFAGIPCAADVDMGVVARETASCTARDFAVLARQAMRVASQRQAPPQKTGPAAAAAAAAAFGAVEMRDVRAALAILQERKAGKIGAPKIPTVKWADVGGLGAAKTEILDTIQLPLQHPELLAQGLQRSGVLLYGPPGTGKTLLAKAVATECNLNFFSVKGPELINPYVGQSEANIRNVFAKARAARPCVVFFDELDSLAPNRGRTGDSGGVMDRIVSQLLAELDGMNSSSDVFIIAATNRPDLIDPGLLRPGRLDRLIYLSAPSKEDQRRILGALTRKYVLAEDFDMDLVVSNCSDNLTGADLYAVCSDAMLNAIRRCIEELEAKRGAGGAGGAGGGAGAGGDSDDGGGGGGGDGGDGGDDGDDDQRVEVETVDFLAAIKDLKPSVSHEELAHYASLHSQFSTS